MSATAPAPQSIPALARRSVEVIHAGQAPTGAYLACPTFEPYRYCWFRDGSFIAHAMSLVGEAESADAFFDWCAGVLLARADRIRAGEHPHTRYTAAGEESASEWPTFQLDGFGLLLWALAEHAGRHGRLEPDWEAVVELLTPYLAAHWRTPCTDWWEEREGVHAATLACLGAGLRAWDRPEAGDVLAAPEADPLRAPLDASLLACATPLRAVDAARLAPVLERLERELVSPGGGVHRHRDDTYYGGGEWLLLTALLGLHYAELGRLDDARAALAWVAAHARPTTAELPEQSQDHLLAPRQWRPWVEKWGEPACPLLWSHAMFLLLARALGDA